MTPTQTLEMLAATASHVAHATARQSAVLRETMYLGRVGRHLQVLNPTELDRAHRFCGFLNGYGWQVLSTTLGLVNGEDPAADRMDGRRAHVLYQPRTNFGGWVRVFRSKAAALPKSDALVDTMVEAALRQAQVDQAGEEWVKGLYGLNPIAPVSREELRERIQESDLFTAPWMVAVWRPDQQWVVEGAASKYVRGADSGSPIVQDLFTRPYADQVPALNGYGELVIGTGPDLGLSTVIQNVDLALRQGYRLDLLLDPVTTPLDAWEDGVEEVGETSLMGVAITTLTNAWLVTFALDRDQWRIDGVAREDFPVFREATGVDPQVPLCPADFETLVSLGIPAWGRIPSFAPAK